MEKWLEATGRNEDEAVNSALQRLGLSRDEVSVEILQRAKSGLFGFGKTPARVKVRYEAPEVAAPTPAAKKESAPAAQKAPAEAAQPPAAQPAEVSVPKTETAAPVKAETAAPVKAETAAPAAAAQTAESAAEDTDATPAPQAITDYLAGLFSHMGVTATPQIEGNDKDGYQVVLVGERLGGLIGHRGETLDAIQQLTNYSVNRSRSRRVRIHLDLENYRAKREETLRNLAKKVAGKVVKYRRNVTLEPMNAYERHIIHETLQDYPDIITYSTGTEPNRRTVVAYSRGKHTY